MTDYKIVIAITSDYHCGGTTALCPPTVTLDDGGTYRQSKLQGWLWVNFMAYWDMIDKLLDTPKERPQLFLVHLGDLIEGQHHRNVQTWSPNINDHIRAAEQCLDEGYKRNPAYSFFVRGTAAHVGEAGQAEEALAKNFNAVQTDHGGWSWYHLQLDLMDVLSDYLHHGSGGQREWTKANAALNQAADLSLNYAERGIVRAPDIAFRAHTHQKSDSFDNYRIRVVGIPSWQLSTGYGYKIGRGKGLPVGSCALLIGEEGYHVEKYIRWAPRVKAWTESQSTKENTESTRKGFLDFLKRP
ncbi:MAG: hypothetical protein GF334_00660 [Candidatus Altiarchaeales archaeon]|nr:hypothetical protein [Candidatus Altiarchaeales archaeon]